MIVDQYGRPICSNKPVRREIAVASIYDRYSTYPSNGLTPQKLAQIFREADGGDVYRQAEMFEEMEEKDTHLFSQLQTRKNAVTGLEFEVLPFSSDPEDKKIADLISDCINNIESIEDVFMDLLDAVGKGFAVSEIIWGFDEGRVVVEDIKSKHQKKFFWDESDIFKVRTDEFTNGIELPANKFIIHKYKAKSGHPSRAGVLRVCAWMYLFKNYDVKDWVAFCETFGMPLRLGKYAPGASEEDKAALMQALVQLGSDAAGMISMNTEIEFKESSKSSSINVFESLANFCNKEMSKAILGQTLTTDIGSSGSFAASQTHDSVRHDLLKADCKALAQTIGRDLIKPLVMFNFGETKRLPWIKFYCDPPEDTETTAKTYAVVINEIGLPVTEEHLYEKLSIPKPEPGQKIVKGQAVTEQVQQVQLKDQPTELIANSDTDEYQKGIDYIADYLVEQSGAVFKDMFKPLLKLIDDSSSLEEIQRKLTDPQELERIYKDMNSQELEELLQKSMFLADMLGRMSEDEQHPEGD